MQIADCPFIIKIRGNQADGSYVITKADLEHKGHEVSEEHFKKHSKRGGISHVVHPILEKSLNAPGREEIHLN